MSASSTAPNTCTAGQEGLRKGAATVLTEIRLAQCGSYARRVQEGTTVGDGEDARRTEGRSRAGGESGEE